MLISIPNKNLQTFKKKKKFHISNLPRPKDSEKRSSNIIFGKILCILFDKFVIL